MHACCFQRHSSQCCHGRACGEQGSGAKTIAYSIEVLLAHPHAPRNRILSIALSSHAAARLCDRRPSNLQVAAVGQRHKDAGVQQQVEHQRVTQPRQQQRPGRRTQRRRCAVPEAHVCVKGALQKITTFSCRGSCRGATHKSDIVLYSPYAGRTSFLYQDNLVATTPLPLNSSYGSGCRIGLTLHPTGTA